MTSTEEAENPERDFNQELLNNLLAGGSDNEDADICRVCRTGGDMPLYHPCKCAGTIKFVHQGCLVEWLKYSKKDVCELCLHKFSFKPIYKPDMPKRLPLSVVHSYAIFKDIQNHFPLPLRYAYLDCFGAICLLPVACNDILHRLAVSSHTGSFQRNIAFRKDMLGYRGFLSFIWIKEQIIQSAQPDFLNLPPENAGTDEEQVDINIPQEHNIDGFNLNNENVEEVGVGQEQVPINEDANLNEDGGNENNLDPFEEGLRNNFEEGMRRYLEFEDLVNHPEIPEAVNIGELRNVERPQIGDLQNGWYRGVRYEVINHEEPDGSTRVEIRPLLPHLRENMGRDIPDRNYNNPNDQVFANVDINAVGEEFNGFLRDMNGIAAEQQENIVPVEDNHQEDQNREAEAAAAANEQEENDEWIDRAVEEFTWRRFLGFDGTFLFLEHILWMLGLTVLFTIFFGLLPYMIGVQCIPFDLLPDTFRNNQTFFGILSGYLAAMITFYSIHKFAGTARLPALYRISGIGYLMFKVLLLMVVEIIMFPLASGVWLDLCSLSAFNSTIQNRMAFFSTMPWAFIMVRWTLGMSFIFYSASFIMNLRELLRAEVLWFIRNLNDPDFNPLHEMIEQPLSRHTRRTIISVSIFFLLIILVAYIPFKLIGALLPSILPFRINLITSAETATSDFSLELIILQMFMPTILNHFNARAFTKSVAKVVCLTIGKKLGLLDYLLAPEDRKIFNQNEEPLRFPVELGIEDPLEEHHLGNQHLAMQLNEHARNGNEINIIGKPKYFALRLLALLLCTCVIITAVSTSFYVIPTSLGRYICYLGTGSSKMHEFYTFGIGIYMCWLIYKALAVVFEWATKGWTHIVNTIKHYAMIIARVSLAAAPLFGAFPFLFGYYVYVILNVPHKAYNHQNASFNIWSTYAAGFVYCKLFCVAVTTGPEWWMKHALETLYLNGLRGLQLKVLYRDLVCPVVAFFLFQISTSIILGELMFAVYGGGMWERLLITKFSAPATAILQCVLLLILWQYTKVRSLSQKIRNEQYLIGQELMNFHKR
uniref:RING-CH-type domain-containing protein n=1 Tax=Rhabditophanes sp. KR3021 TaxID=114890 RepID=A0AC35TQQ8_9BILA